MRFALLVGLVASSVWTTPLGTTPLAAGEPVRVDDSAPAKNILFVMMDDLRPELACYGETRVHSPHIDRLAADATVFQRAYCNVPVCGASRASLFTGIRPTRDRYVDYDCRVDHDTPDVPTMASHLKANGLTAISMGKILHFPADSADHWSRPPWRPDYTDDNGQQISWQDYQSPENRRISADDPRGFSFPYESADVDDDAYRDGQIASQACEQIRQFGRSGEPFFLAVGFLKPHLPFNAPQKYWDLYDAEVIGDPENYFVPKDAPAAAIHSFGEMRPYRGVPDSGPVPDEMARQLIHGYLACISYVDAQLGRLMAALDDAGLADNTAIILCGDHGWNLGDHTLWCKHSNFDTSTRTALIAKFPGGAAGGRWDGLVEFVDLMPTMCEIIGADIPETCDGQSLLPILRGRDVEPRSMVHCRWKPADTIVTPDFAYTQWTTPEGARWSEMLYDHRKDPHENVNVVGQADYQSKVWRLRGKLETVLQQSESVD